ncbi:type II toxin-antitoxin system Phd/YefM family antitoxin [Paracidovorax citrulli]
MVMVNMHDAKSQLSRLVDAVEKGVEKEVVISRNGKPVARLVPLEPRGAVRIGAGRPWLGSLVDDIDIERFDQSNDEIERMFCGSAG